jgi:hypothetical protein
MAVSGSLQGIMITGAHARRIFAVPADGSKGGVFPQIGDTVILRVIKIATAGFAFPALIADIQIDE